MCVGLPTKPITFHDMTDDLVYREVQLTGVSGRKIWETWEDFAKAANQYRKTRSQLMKLAAEPGEDAQAQALDAVAAYTQTFNKMGFIETEERDEIYMALRGILDALPDNTLQKDALIEKFEQLRDF